MTKQSSGQILIHALILMALSVVFMTVLANIALSSLNALTRAPADEQAVEIAEAGIEYYRWHLAHSPNDFTNGTGQSGPYTMPYKDKNDVVIGQFVLTITPPVVGSSVVTVRSLGQVFADQHAVKRIEAKFAYPSLAEFAVISNTDILFDVGSEVFGKVHSNSGVHFDGIAHSIVSSSVSEYNDPDHSGGNEFGVHTHILPVDPAPPSAVPVRLDVFKAGRQFPLPAVDFNGITADLAEIKADAQSGGKYFPASGLFGYDIVLKTNDTFDISMVILTVPKPLGCSDTIGDPDWGTWSVLTSLPIGNYPFPANGLIFVEDNVWVSGKINGARLTIAAAKFPDNPSRRKSITVNKDLLYTNYDGSDVLGLIAQDDINVGLYSADNLRIDAALVAKNGRIGRFYYLPPVGPNVKCGSEATRSQITVDGIIASNESYGFSWTRSGVFASGYASRKIIYDTHLLTNPPPSFPLVTDEYRMISWEELQ